MRQQQLKKEKLISLFSELKFGLSTYILSQGESLEISYKPCFLHYKLNLFVVNFVENALFGPPTPRASPPFIINFVNRAHLLHMVKFGLVAAANGP